MIKKLRDPDEKVRAQAAWALGVHRDRIAVPPLIAALKDTNGEVRASAAGALGDIGDKRAVMPSSPHRRIQIRLCVPVPQMPWDT